MSDKNKFVGLYDIRKKKLSIRKTRKDSFSPFFSTTHKIKFYFETISNDPYLAAINKLQIIFDSFRADFFKSFLNDDFLTIKTKDDQDAD